LIENEILLMNYLIEKCARLLIVCLLGFSSVGAVARSASLPERPNIIVILCDDLGYGDLACYGHPHIRTPHLDKMASEGIRFTDFYSAAPVCSPSRVGLLTGRSPNRAGVYDWIPPARNSKPDRRHEVHMRSSEVTIAQVLKQAGYATAMAGKWHCNSQFNSESQPQPGDAGFDHWMATQNNAAPSHANPTNFVRNADPLGELEGYSCQLVVDEGMDWLDRHLAAVAEQPFFLFLSFHEPHEPVASPPEMTAGYQEVTVHEKEADYFANVENVDRAVGRLMAYLHEVGIDDNTLVVFTSDNGPETLSRYPNATRSWGRANPLRGMKLWTTDAGFRVAGIMRWPNGIAAGQVSTEVVSSLDFLPTFGHLAGTDIPAGLELDGTNFLPALEDEPLERNKPLLWAYYNSLNERQVAMRDGPWKVLARIDVPRTSNLFTANIAAVKAAELRDFQIFNMEHDVGEARDMAKSFPETRSRLVQTLERNYRDLLSGSHVW
jgi:arylsulfatase A